MMVPRPSDTSPDPRRVATEALRAIAAELRFEAEHDARTSRDFGRGMSWAATVIETRADDPPWLDHFAEQISGGFVSRGVV